MFFQRSLNSLVLVNGLFYAHDETDSNVGVKFLVRGAMEPVLGDCSLYLCTLNFGGSDLKLYVEEAEDNCLVKDTIG
jgi:hypothetical protein